MAAKVKGASGFLIDGYPADMEEANKFEKQVVPVTRLGLINLSTKYVWPFLLKSLVEQRTPSLYGCGVFYFVSLFL